MPKRGLPATMKMRHDEHYVEALASSAGAPIGRLVPIEQIEPNPHQPRQLMGDLSELMASIAEKGVIEPLIVRQRGSRFQIIAGERRYQASVQVGLRELPVVIRDVDDGEVIELALIENIQRKDLTPFEEAEGFAVLQQKFGYTHDKISQVIGKSRTTITETLLINEIPDRIRALCRESGISSKSVLVQVARAGSEEAMEQFVRAYGAGEMSREELRKQTARPEPKKAGRPKNYVFALKDKALPFTLNLAFKKPNVERAEVIDAVRELLRRLESE